MTATSGKRMSWTAVISMTSGLLVIFIVWLFTTGWSSIVKRSEFDLHVQREGYLHERAAFSDSIQRELLLDVLCSPNVDPDNRDCSR